MILFQLSLIFLKNLLWLLQLAYQKGSMKVNIVTYYIYVIYQVSYIYIYTVYICYMCNLYYKLNWVFSEANYIVR